MKLEPHFTSSAVGSHRLLLALACLLPLLALAAPPGWWADRQVLDSNATKNDYGPANQGQLKNIATKAYEELQAKLPVSTWSSPEGQTLTALIASWNPTQSNNYGPVNQGQLKAVAKSFYDVLILEGYATVYPWTDTTADDANYAPANIGQVKNIFAFDLGGSATDSDGNGLADAWEITYFGQTGVDPNADPDGDGLNNLQEYQNGTSPLDYYNAQTLILIKVSGDNQQGLPNTFLPLPLVVRITDSNGQTLHNAPVTFAVVDGGGLLAGSVNGAAATFFEARTDSNGTAAAFYIQGANAGVTSHVTAIAAAAQVAFASSTTPAQGLTADPNNINATVNAGANSLVPLTVTNNTSAAVSYTVELDGDTLAIPSFTDSDRVGGPVFVWNDISTSGTRLDTISDADDASEEVSLSFAVPYFGSTYNNVFVNSNGFVTLGASGGDYNYYRLPDPNAPANQIAAFHTDLFLNENGGGSGDVYFQDFGDHAIIQFNHAARIYRDGFATFQIVLNADGTILFYYLDMSGTLDDCVVGLQNQTKDKGITVAYQQAYLKSGLAVRLVDATEWLSVSPISGSLAAGASTTFDVVLDARALASGTYNGAVTVSAISSPDLSVTVPVAMNINAGPEVSIISPEEGWLFTEAAEITLQASALDQDGVSKVEFYDGAEKLGEAASAPYTFQWHNLPLGTRVLTVLAVDNLGAVRRSTPVDIEVQADTDHDGIGDEWEMSYFGSLDENAEGDFDHDGLTNAEEWNLRVNPAQADTDGDGVSDGDEVHEYHTDPNQTDSDGDGLSDSWEVNYGLDPLHDDSQVDADGDGLTNAEELALGTVPNNPDTDGDGVIDGTDGWPLHPQLAPPRVPATKYAIIDLGEGFAAGLNNHGDVVGTSGQDPSEAMLWKIGESPVALGFLTSDTSAYRVSSASAINDDGVVVGRATYSWDPVVGTDYPNPPVYNQLLTRFDETPEHNLWWDTHAFRWSAGVMTDLNDLTYGQHGDGTMPDTSNKGTSAATGINQAGVAVGDSDSSIQLYSGWYWEIVSDVQHAVRFQDGIPVDLGLGPSAGEPGAATAYAINDSGSIIGFQSRTAGDSGYFLAGGQVETLPFDPGGLNNLDQVVGSAWQSNRYLASLWVSQPLLAGADRLVDLDAIARNAGFVGSSFASRIGDRVEILGEATPQGAFENAGAIWRNGQIARLDDLIGEPGWLINTVGINANGMIAATGFNNANPNGDRALLLLPVELMVDGNRDGEMSFTDALIHDKDQTTAEKPYRFWINDDRDDSENDETVGSLTKDSDNATIDTTRDLEDFSRIWINIGGLHDAIVSGQIEIGLEWKDVTFGSPSIRIYPAVGNGSTEYLSSQTIASQQLTAGYGNAVTSSSGHQQVDAQGLRIPTSFWTGLSEGNSSKFLVFEGKDEGTGQLVISFYRSDGSKIGSGPGVALDLVNVKKMYERAKATPDDVSNPHEFATTPPLLSVGWVLDPNGNQWNYPPVSWYETKEYVIAVHGWNVSYDSARTYFAETTFKRLWQRGYRGRFAAFYWPTLVGDFTFNESEFRAWNYGRALQQYVDSISGDYTKALVAHSMGNVISGAALQKGLHVSHYAMLNAAAPASCYDDNAALQQGFGNSPDNDLDQTTLQLAYKNKFSATSVHPVNFYLTSDSALMVWVENNRAFKPEVFYEGAGGDHAYKYYPGNPSGQKLFLSFVLGDNRILERVEESLAYAAKSSTLAVGAEAAARGTVSGSVDLSQFGYESEHSAFWTFTLPMMSDAYDTLLDELRLEHNP